ncbi:MAG: DNA-binding protein [Bacteroidetes bacterium GWF2_43_63]|nr:MAG: DNA-binding protein [Bacteroidetes bacterium GWE2_42_42]OFY55040.1 MAG: DNA-binding protein [Bacteroidetes bacterium GWF2_43_63]HBG69577.1 DNA-binding protein [Bacteroidales bacterium]HCB60684.1 DNA-binding protein [Bacteroidales bacterium]HCY24012.1 DNA-binding protein [Bacteroidales bacterium]
MKNEIIIYQPNELASHIEVRVDEDTVWLSLNQIAQLFERDKSVISRHLRNVYKEGELSMEATVAKNATVQIEAGREVKREIEFYNLDAILSVGYRVNSKQGTQFRMWANKILKDYLLKGYALNNRMNRIEENVDSLAKKVKGIDLQIKAALPPSQGLFFDGQIFDAYTFVSELIKSAKQSIVLIDNYVDETVLTLLSKRKKSVFAIIYSSQITKQLKLDLQKHNQQYAPIELLEFSKSHDRFLIIDEVVYHFGASLKDLGKKWFAFSKMEMTSGEILCKLRI